MAGMAWTLHPALLYEKFGPVLVNLWESGAFGTLFRSGRRPARTVGSAIGSECDSGATGEQADQDGHSALRLSPDSVPTADSALERANRELDNDSSPEPSSSQQNELAFQGDIYTQQRRVRKQRERAREARRARRMLEDANRSHKRRRRRRSSILSADKRSPQRGRSRRRHSLNTPGSDAAGAIPTREVRIDQSTASLSSAGWVTDDEAEESFFPEDQDSLYRFRTARATAGGKVRSAGATPLVQSPPLLRRGGRLLSPLTPDISDSLLAAAADTSGSPTKDVASTPASSLSADVKESDGYMPEAATPALESFPSSVKSTAEIWELTENQKSKTGLRHAEGSEEKHIENDAVALRSPSQQHRPQDSLTTVEDRTQLPDGAVTFTAQLKTESSGVSKGTTRTATHALASSGPDVADVSRQFLGDRLLPPAYKDISMSRSISEPQTNVASPIGKAGVNSQESRTSASHTPFTTSPDYLVEGPFSMLQEWGLRRSDEASHIHTKAVKTGGKERAPVAAPPAASVDSATQPAAKPEVTTVVKAAAEYNADASDKAAIRPHHSKRNERPKPVFDVLQSATGSVVTQSSQGSFTVSSSGLMLELEEQHRRKKLPSLALVETDFFGAERSPTIPAGAAHSDVQATGKETTTTETLVQSKTDHPSSQADTRSNERPSKTSHKSRKGKAKKHGGRSIKRERKKKRFHEAASPEYAIFDDKVDDETSVLEREQSPSAVKKQGTQRGIQRPPETVEVPGSSMGSDASKGRKSKAATPASALSEDDFEPDSVSHSPSGSLKLRVRTSTRSKSSMLWPFGTKPE